MTRLIPILGFHRWLGDGLHGGPVNGRVFEFAWLGLHVEIAVSFEGRGGA